MTQYLLSLSVGPVQEFIAAARRTADLHAGSRLLQAVTGAAAAALPDPGAAAHAPGRIFPVDPRAGGANKILAIVDNPQQAAEAAKAASRRALDAAWQQALARVPQEQRRLLDLARAQAQVAGFLEVYAAWLPTTAESYPATRQAVERLLAGRKALRDFPQQLGDDAGIPNSALDPTRPSVLVPRYRYRTPSELHGWPLRLKQTEVLDAVSVLKRLRGADLGAVLSTRDLAQRAVIRGYTGPEEDPVDPDYPYFAVLVADGDRMGRLIGELATPEAHRDLSRQLDSFTAEANEIVDAADGQLVYAGGDDVLALLPVTDVLDCAELLAGAFTDNVPGATLSVGVAVVHYRDPLSLALTRARAAERLAKQHRNAVAMSVHPRGGAPLRVSQPWPADPLRTWLGHTRRGRVSRGLPYALSRLAASWPAAVPAAALQAETRRAISHAQPRVAEAVLADLPQLGTAADLHRFADLLVLTRFLTGRGLPA